MSNIFDGQHSDQDASVNADNSQQSEAVDSNQQHHSSESESAQQSQLNFIGEGKKYSDLSEADKGIANAQEHIKKIEQENAEMRERLNKAKSVEEVLEKLEERRQASEQKGESTTPFNKDELEKLIAERTNEQLKQRELQKQQEQHKQYVQKELLKAYGDQDSAVNAMQQKAQEYGMDMQELDSLALNRPQAFLALVKGSGSEQKPVSSVDQGYSRSVKSEALAQSNSGNLQDVFAQIDRRKENGEISRQEAYKLKFQAQMKRR